MWGPYLVHQQKLLLDKQTEHAVDYKSSQDMLRPNKSGCSRLHKTIHKQWVFSIQFIAFFKVLVRSRTREGVSLERVCHLPKSHGRFGPNGRGKGQIYRWAILPWRYHKTVEVNLFSFKNSQSLLMFNQKTCLKETISKIHVQNLFEDVWRICQQTVCHCLPFHGNKLKPIVCAPHCPRKRQPHLRHVSWRI